MGPFAELVMISGEISQRCFVGSLSHSSRRRCETDGLMLLGIVARRCCGCRRRKSCLGPKFRTARDHTWWLTKGGHLPSARFWDMLAVVVLSIYQSANKWALKRLSMHHHSRYRLKTSKFAPLCSVSLASAYHGNTRGLRNIV